MNEEVILTLKIGPCSKCESTIRVTLLLLSLLKTKGFISLQALGELSENEDGRGVGRGKGGEEGRGSVAPKQDMVFRG